MKKPLNYHCKDRWQTPRGCGLIDRIRVFFVISVYYLHTSRVFMQKVPIFITLLEYQDVRKLVIKYRAKFLIQTTTKIYFLPLFIDNFRKEFTRIILIS